MARRDTGMLERGDSLREMNKDRALVRAIQKNPSDPGVKREAMAIEQQRVTYRKQADMQQRYKKLDQAKTELRKSGGYCG